MFYNNALDTQELMQRIANDLIDSYDEELELEIEDREVDDIGAPSPGDKLARQQYFKDLFACRASWSSCRTGCSTVARRW